MKKISSFCNLGNCVEVDVPEEVDGVYTIGDTKTGLTTSSPFTREEMARFIAGVQAGHYDVEVIAGGSETGGN